MLKLDWTQHYNREWSCRAVEVGDRDGKGFVGKCYDCPVYCKGFGTIQWNGNNVVQWLEQKTGIQNIWVLVLHLSLTHCNTGRVTYALFAFAPPRVNGNNAPHLIRLL